MNLRGYRKKFSSPILEWAEEEEGDPYERQGKRSGQHD